MTVTDRLETRLRHIIAGQPAAWVDPLVAALKVHEALRAGVELRAFLGTTELPAASPRPRGMLLVGRTGPDGRPECRPLAVAVAEHWVRVAPTRPSDGLHLIIAPRARGRAYWFDGEPADLEDVLRGAGPLPESVEHLLRAVIAAWGTAADPARAGLPPALPADPAALPPDLLARVRASLGLTARARRDD